MVHSYSGILFSLKTNEPSTYEKTWWKLKYILLNKKSKSEYSILSDSNYMRLWNRWNYGGSKNISGFQKFRGSKWCISRVQGTFRQWNCYSVWCKYICHYIFVKIHEICNTKSKLQYKLWNLVNNNVLILADQFHKYTTPMQEANNTEKWGWVQEYMGCLCI